MRIDKESIGEVAYLALLQQWRADVATSRACAEEAMTRTSTYHAPHYRSWAAIPVSYTLALEQPTEPLYKRLLHERWRCLAFRLSIALC